MRSSLNKRIFVAAIALVIGVGIYTVSLPTADAIGGPSVCAYYSNASYTTVVGARGTGCCGTIISWGITTKYKKCEVLYCTQGLCPN